MISKKLIIYVLIMFGIVLSLALPTLLLASQAALGPSYCNELKNYLSYSQNRLKVLHKLEAKLQRDQVEYNKMCSTAKAGN